jgi:hypothetical protein
MDLNEILRADEVANGAPVPRKWRNESCQCEDAGVEEQLDHLANTTTVLRTVLRAEPETGTQTVAHIVAVKSIGMTAHKMPSFFHHVRHGGLARAGQAGKPHHGTPMPIQRFAPLARNGAMVSDDVNLFHLSRSRIILQIDRQKIPHGLSRLVMASFSR